MVKISTMSFKSIDPYRQQLLAEYAQHTSAEIEAALCEATRQQIHFAQESVAQRGQRLRLLASLLEQERDVLARIMTLEMGKPLRQARAEIEKCVWLCTYYAEKAPEFLAERPQKTAADYAAVRYRPLGVILGIMPWNFPFWQVLRCAVPVLLGGNAFLLKHAPQVQGSAEALQRLFDRAGFEAGLFQNVRVEVVQIPRLIADPRVKAVSLTGSELAGRAVARQAGEALKKVVLELGGSNAMVVLADADIERAAALAVQARMQNNGQSCIAAKRLIVSGNRGALFAEAYRAALAQYIPADPLEDTTQLGPMARIDLAEKLQEQMQQSLAMGATLLAGGQRDQALFEATLLGSVRPEMPVFREETFGPLAALMETSTDEEALHWASHTHYGLGMSILTARPQRAITLAEGISDGALFINEMVLSDPRLPFGGTGLSGYGRELAREGLMEFVNHQTLYRKDRL